jgi:hypothetical protein
MRGTARHQEMRGRDLRTVVARDGLLGAANGVAIGITIGLIGSSSLVLFAIACAGAGALAGAALGLILEAVGPAERP